MKKLKGFLLRVLGIPIFEANRIGATSVITINRQLTPEELQMFKEVFQKQFCEPEFDQRVVDAMTRAFQRSKRFRHGDDAL